MCIRDRKKVLIVALGLIASCNSTQKTVTTATKSVTNKAVNPIPYAETITEDELKEHLYIYASDEFEGRETGKPGQKKAIEYLKKQYENLGVPAAQGDGNYFQKVPLENARVVFLPIASDILLQTDFSVVPEIT